MPDSIVTEDQDHVDAVNAFWDGDLARSLRLTEKTVARDPTSAKFHWHRAVTLLQAGQWTEGWAEFEWRIPNFQKGYQPISGEQWKGDPLNGRRLVVHTEQGFGDAIMWSRYLPWLGKQNGEVILVAHDALGPLFKSWAAPNTKVVWPSMGGNVEYDCWVWLGSLPWLHGTRLDSIPPCRGKWRGRRPIRKVGFCWHGERGMPQDELRSMPFWEIKRLLECTEFEFFSFQYGEPGTCIPRGADWLKTAELLGDMDAMVSVDTAVAHLAGTLGVETHLMLGDRPDWRYPPHISFSPWYPSMTVYKQDTRRWDGIVNSVIASLTSRAGRDNSRLLGAA